MAGLVPNDEGMDRVLVLGPRAPRKRLHFQLAGSAACSCFVRLAPPFFPKPG